MATSTDPANQKQLVRQAGPTRAAICLACGATELKRGRRYCTKECRQRMHWVLSLSKGLLKTFNVRYAAFYFTPGHVVLDMLPAWSKCISRFTVRRTPGLKPAEDLKELVLSAGHDWYRMVDNKSSKSHASLTMVSKNNNTTIDPRSLRPNQKSKPRLSKEEKGCIKVLKLDLKDLASEVHLK